MTAPTIKITDMEEQTPYHVAYIASAEEPATDCASSPTPISSTASASAFTRSAFSLATSRGLARHSRASVLSIAPTPTPPSSSAPPR